MHRSAVLPLALLLAACTSAAGTVPSPTTQPSPTPAATSPRYDRPTGPNDLVLRVSVGGGFVAPVAHLTQIPMFSLFGDGRVIRPGPQIMIYPGPLRPNLQSMTLSPDAIDALLARAEAAGLFGPDADLRAGGIMDAGTTVFTSHVNGTHTISAYALTEGAPDAASADPERAARAKLSAFLTTLPDGPTTAYTPTSLRLLVAPHVAGTDDQTANGLTRGTKPWPVSSISLRAAVGQPPVADPWRCITLDGADAAAFWAAAGSANALTLWTEQSRSYEVALRPLLPDESGCPPAG
jgi:hypothetical protein